MKTRWAEKAFNYRRTLNGRLRRMWYSMQYRLLRDPSYAHRVCKFTKDEFYKWALSQSDYRECFDKWERSNFQRLLVPTIDRINPEGDYSFENIRIVSWQINMNSPRKYFSSSERKEAERRWDKNKRARLTRFQKDRLNKLARIRYTQNKNKINVRRRELYLINKTKGE